MSGGAVSTVPNADVPLALDVQGLTGPVPTPLLRDIALRVRRGGVHVVLAPMHSGKSLLLRLLLGLERAERGSVAVGGQGFDAAHPNENDLQHVRRRVGVVFESSALISRLTLLENVELPLIEHTTVGGQTARDVAANLLRDVGVVRDIDRTPDELSRLDRRRAALARALALTPALLVIDEPGNRLDPHAATDLDETLRDLHDRFAWGLLICTQEVRYAFRWPEAVSVLAGGRIVEQGSLDHLLNSRHEAVRRFVDRRGAA